MPHSVKSLELCSANQQSSKSFFYDLYFRHEYAELYEEIEKGQTETVYFESRAGKLEYTFLKRPVPVLSAEAEDYFDITTAYGYGGPRIIEAENPELLLQEFQEEFSSYCRKNRIVSEFVRFHLFESGEIRRNFTGEIGLIGHHIVRDLKQDMKENMHKSVHSSVRKAQKKGLSVTFDREGKYLEDFLAIYHQTMERNGAEDFYYFDDDFFRDLQEKFPSRFVYAHAWAEGKIVASFLNILGENAAYAFLGGTLKEYFNYEASTFLEYLTIEWLKEEGFSFYVLGGGYSGDDGLYRYKRKFNLEGNCPFYIGKKIHNEEMYQKLTEWRQAAGGFDLDCSFFPLYRMGLSR